MPASSAATPRIRLLTTAPLPEADRDEGPLVDALRALGADVQVVPWRQAEPENDRSTLWVPRSTWDYHLDRDQFLRVVARLAAKNTLLNPLHLIRWNTSKTYLRDLRQNAVPIVPTAFLGRGEGLFFDEVVGRHGWSDVIVKPQVGAASFRTRRFAGAEMDAARQWVEAECRERAVLVQGYVPAVETTGERAIVVLGGEISHAVRKSRRLEGDHEHVSDAVAVEPDERVLVDVALRPYRQRLLYARVDVVRDPRGVPMIMELELVEPSLFLLEHPPALNRFAQLLMQAGAGAHQSSPAHTV